MSIQETPPDVLYKYRSINEYCERLLSLRELYFPRIEEINDPFDATVVLSRQADPKTLWNHTREMLRRKYGALPDRDLLFRWIRSSPGMDALPEHKLTLAVDEAADDPERFVAKLNVSAGHDAILRGRRATVRICSLTSNPVSIPMWSYYAGGHSGVCIGFRTDGDTVFAKAGRVQYETDYPTLNYFSADDEEYYRLSILTKSVDWKHESEWRLTSGYGLAKWDGRLVVSPTSYQTVIFGCRTSAESRESVIRWAQAGQLSVTFQIARPSAGRFALELVPYQ